MEELHEIEDESALYESSEVHTSVMRAKELTWGRHRAAGRYDPAQYLAHTNYTRCVDGKAGEFLCNNVDRHTLRAARRRGSEG